jgi:opacity protein-like surface antigen
MFKAKPVAAEQHRPEICTEYWCSAKSLPRYGVCKIDPSVGGKSAMIKRLTSLFAITTFVIAASGFAFAADMGAPRTPPAPVPVAYDWSGLYVGGHVGYGWSTTTFSDPSADSVLSCCFTPANLGGASATNATPSAFLGGAHAGWMYQVARLVVGGDFDWSAMNMKGSGSSVFNVCGLCGAATEAYSINTKWTGTATTTIGIARDRLLFYAKAGGAWAENTYGLEAGAPAFCLFPHSPSQPTALIKLSPAGRLVLV